MLKIKPQNPKGVRDYLPLENQRREYIISVIKKHYELYGFSSIYNPVFERLETLQGKYGEEGDKLLFKILNSGEYLSKNSDKLFTGQIIEKFIRQIIEKYILLEFNKAADSVAKDTPQIKLSEDVIKKFAKIELEPIKKNGYIDSGEIQEIVNNIFSNKELIVNIEALLNERIKFYFETQSYTDQDFYYKIENDVQEMLFNWASSTQNLIFIYSKYLTKNISEKGLRYDHTVPLARFVSQHQNELTFPFKRYVIGPVWRADRPQKGRYQEFFQCDADIVGSKGLVSDVEMITLIDNVFKELNLKVEIKINNRKIYNGICDSIDIEKSQVTPVSTILDKWDKIGGDKVKEELSKLIGEEKTNKLIDILSIQNFSELSAIENAELKEGISELEYIFKYSKSQNLKFDLRLLRGLDYYTGTILEMVSTEMEYGSIGGGGRYDDLTELFGLKDMSGIGISFGLDRVYDVMTELKKFPENSEAKKTLILNLTEAATSQYFSLLSEIRGAGKIVDLYPSIAKMDKQLTYADKAGYSYAIIIGEKELEDNQITIKDLKQRQQTVSKREQILSFL